MSLVLTVLGNLLPLLGVLFAKWDIYTLLIYYWCETGIIGFWTVVTISLHEGDEGRSLDGATPRNATNSTTSALFITLHAGFFMAIHLFLMSSLYGEAWPGHLTSPQVFIETFLVEQNLWPMLAVVFLQRAAIVWQERHAPSIRPAIAGLYLRIIVMQVVIIIGSWGVLLLDTGLFGLMLLVLMKTLLDFYWPRVINYAVATMRMAPK